MKYLAIIKYDGSKFEGFQRLNNGQGVQNEIENVLSKIAKQKVEIKGAGRTDRKVHALGQAISFDLDIDITLSKLKYVMNRLLNPYVSVLRIQNVDDTFHARYSAKEKTYVYKAYYGEKDPFLSDYVTYIYQKPNLLKMKKAAKLFLGTHSFNNYVSGFRDNYETTIYDIKIKKQGNYYYFILRGTGFYRYMVRHIVGALLEVGFNKISFEDISFSLFNPTQKVQFMVAEPQGLYLKEVKY